MSLHLTLSKNGVTVDDLQQNFHVLIPRAVPQTTMDRYQEMSNTNAHIR